MNAFGENDSAYDFNNEFNGKTQNIDAITGQCSFCVCIVVKYS